MYPQPELSRLAAHKAALQRGITLRRTRCVAAAAQIVRPLAWLDQAMALWRRISPVAKLTAIPLAIVAGRTLLPRMKILGTFLRWAPAVLGAVRSFGQR